MNAEAPAASAENTWYAAPAAVIKKTEAGEYDVYMKVVGDANHADITPTKVGTVVIGEEAGQELT